jgi:hypothetical protein
LSTADLIQIKNKIANHRYAPSMHKILTTRARLHNAEQMKALLSPIKHGDELGADLSDGDQGTVELYDRETKTFRYLVSDGRSVACYTVTGLTLVQAATIAAACDAICVFNFESFALAVEVALGPVHVLQ